MKNLLLAKQAAFIAPGEKLPATHVFQHHISVTDRNPIRQTYRTYPPLYREFINQEVQKLLAQGIIQPSRSQNALPLVLVTKKNGEKRVCIDARLRNKHV